MQIICETQIILLFWRLGALRSGRPWTGEGLYVIETQNILRFVLKYFAIGRRLIYARPPPSPVHIGSPPSSPFDLEPKFMLQGAWVQPLCVGIY